MQGAPGIPSGPSDPRACFKASGMTPQHGAAAALAHHHPAPHITLRGLLTASRLPLPHPTSTGGELYARSSLRVPEDKLRGCFL